MNLSKNIKWTAWSPRKDLSPEFFIGDNKLSITTEDNPNVYGKFLSDKIIVSDSEMIIFEAAFTCDNENIKNIDNSIFAMISFYNNQDKMLERKAIFLAKVVKLLHYLHFFLQA